MPRTSGYALLIVPPVKLPSALRPTLLNTGRIALGLLPSSPLPLRLSSNWLAVSICSASVWNASKVLVQLLFGRNWIVAITPSRLLLPVRRSALMPSEK